MFAAVATKNFEVNLNRQIVEGPSRHKLGTGSSSIDLNEVNNVVYSGPIFIGTPLQGSNSSSFLYDSGSGYLVVTDTTCTSCSTKYYNPLYSTTAQNSSLYSTTAMSYGTTNFKGFIK